jgi:predicted glycogen debranching enzyme
MSRLTIDRASCSDLKKALNCEWLETNGLGGYASSTLLNCNTRKYHGLLVANLSNPQGRHVLLSWFEDSISIQGKEFFLSCCQYPGVFHPEGNCSLAEYHKEHCPHFIYETDNFRIHKAIMMVHGKDTVLIKYTIERCLSPGVLLLKPFLAYRGYHALSRQNTYLRTDTCAIENGFEMRPYDGMPAISIRTNAMSEYCHAPVWYNNFEYQKEYERGFDWREDIFCPGIFEINVTEGNSVIVSATLDLNRENIDKAWIAESKRRAREASKDKKISEKFEAEEDFDHIRNLLYSGRQFLITSPPDRRTIIAGYHWFVDWGRDTLISLPGLTFCSGRPKDGIAILTSLSEHEKNGLLPNYFSDDGTGNAYNTVDTSLWYFWAVQQMLKYTGDMKTITKRMWPTMKKILTGYMEGTSFHIHMSENGLIYQGDKDTQLTWMDATVDGKPVTPRWGFPVEINALWYNAVFFAHELAHHLNDHEFFPFDVLIPQIKKSFIDTFWIGDGAYLGDVFRNGHLDRSVRPNQIITVSLPYSPLGPVQWAGVVEKVSKLLLTPAGLRTLSPEDKNYKGRYEGDGFSRDAAYHQGTVWPWLFGHFGEAYVRAAEDKAAAKTFLLNHIRSFVRRHIPEAGIGCISEIFDGDPPHRPHGCISQAWSAAELIRLYTVLNEIPDS